MDVLNDLIHNPAFWAAIIGVANALQRWLLPQVPDYVMGALNLLAVIVFSSVAGKIVVMQAKLRAIMARGDEPKEFCGTCGAELEAVRPGRYQCPNCG